MSEEFNQDFEALDDALTALGSGSPSSPALAHLTTQIQAALRARGTGVIDTVNELRTYVEQGMGTSLQAGDVEKGLWAAGLGAFALGPGHHLDLNDQGLRDRAAAAGRAVQVFFNIFRTHSGTHVTVLIRQLVTNVIAEGAGKFPAELTARLVRLLEKLERYDGPRTKLIPPPDYWPSTYVSSSSTSGYSSSSSSGWPPE